MDGWLWWGDKVTDEDEDGAELGEGGASWLRSKGKSSVVRVLDLLRES